MVYSRVTTSAMAERWVLPVCLGFVDISARNSQHQRATARRRTEVSGIVLLGAVVARLADEFEIWRRRERQKQKVSLHAVDCARQDFSEDRRSARLPCCLVPASAISMTTLQITWSRADREFRARTLDPPNLAASVLPFIHFETSSQPHLRISPASHPSFEGGFSNGPKLCILTFVGI